MDTIEEGYSLEQHVEGQSRRLDALMLRLDLPQELEELRQGAPFQTNGHIGKTLVKPTHPPDTGGARAADAGERANRAVHGDAACARAVGFHDLEAVEASAVLLTIAWPTL